MSYLVTRKTSPSQSILVVSWFMPCNATDDKRAAQHEVDGRVLPQSNLYTNFWHGKLAIYVRDSLAVFNLCICFHLSLKIKAEQNLRFCIWGTYVNQMVFWSYHEWVRKCMYSGNWKFGFKNMNLFLFIVNDVPLSNRPNPLNIDKSDMPELSTWWGVCSR